MYVHHVLEIRGEKNVVDIDFIVPYEFHNIPKTDGAKKPIDTCNSRIVMPLREGMTLIVFIVHATFGQIDQSLPTWQGAHSNPNQNGLAE